uniref:Uncharacterized protein n=1 Tax=Parascaris univalens TaxID=6257 RepID=A0A914ZQP9_PARUN
MNVKFSANLSVSSVAVENLHYHPYAFLTQLKYCSVFCVNI